MNPSLGTPPLSFLCSEKLDYQYYHNSKYYYKGVVIQTSGLETAEEPADSPDGAADAVNQAIDNIFVKLIVQLEVQRTAVSGFTVLQIF